MRLFVIPLLLLAAPAHAGSEDDSQVWLRAGASGTIAGQVRGSLETVLRFGNDPDGLYEAEYGASLGYEVVKGVTMWAGYIRVPSYGRADNRNEDRFRQQLTFPVGQVGGGRLSGRLRVEERDVSTGDDLGIRLRPYLQWSRPVRAGSKTNLVLSHESFVNLNSTDWGQRDGYDRMRNIVGIAFPLTKAVTADVGYLNQYGFVRGGRDTQEHVANVGLSYAF